MTGPAKPDTEGHGVAYCIVHQARFSQANEEYLHTIRSLHRKVAEESASLMEAHRKAAGETTSREAQVTYGALSQFLVTPLKSDQQEVKKILEEAIGRALTSQSPHAGVRESRLSRALFRLDAAQALHPHCENGEEYYRSIGFQPGKGEIYESDFVVDDGSGLETLEVIVRDRLGIYDGPHGKHIAEAGSWMFAAYNIVAEQRAQNNAPTVLVELPVAKPMTTRYDAFRSMMTRAMEQLAASADIASLGLWQRKLGLGPGREFLLRIGCSDIHKGVNAGLLVLPMLREMISVPGDAGSGPHPLILKEILSPL